MINIDRTDFKKNRASTIFVYFQGLLFIFDYDGSNPLFEAMQDAGFQAPYPCRDSQCTVCKVKIEEGDVVQPHAGGLTMEEMKEGFALACLARPLSQILRISF